MMCSGCYEVKLISLSLSVATIPPLGVKQHFSIDLRGRRVQNPLLAPLLHSTHSLDSRL